eukprot:gene11723-8068_t
MGCGCGSDEAEKAPGEQKNNDEMRDNESPQERRERSPPPAHGSYDEFQEQTIQPLPQPTADYQVGIYRPSDDEEVTTYFEACSPGLLYRIIKGDTWSFYNASRVYEMHIQFTFAGSSAIEALGETKTSTDENNDIVAEAVCYPNEMIQYIRGSADMLTSKIKALPLSEGFLQRKAAENGQYIEQEMRQMQAPENATDDEALARCLDDNCMFVDRHFLPNQNSISAGSRKAMKTVPWARPQMYLHQDLQDQIRTFREEPQPTTVSQSVLGDSWVVSALSAVALQPQYIRSCFYHPHDPRLTREENAHGAYRVTLNKNGWWKNIIVDNYFPVIGSMVKYARSNKEVTEMWVSVLEKAYAKMHQSYAQIVAGDPLMLIQDITGFPTSRYDEAFNSEDHAEAMEFVQRLVGHIDRGHIVIVHTPCRDRSRPEHDRERETIYSEAGLVMGHAYVVRKIVPIEDNGTDSALLQICNPWSKGVKWPGEWREGSRKWEDNFSAAQKCNNGRESNGNFWVSWEEAQRFFSGCGVVFSRPRCMDYRIAGNFRNQIPSVSLKINVQSHATVTFILSMPDHRGTSKAEDDYAPVLLSLGQSAGDPHSVKITENTHLDVEQPSKLFSFIQSRDVAMTVNLSPENSPYFLVPRIMAEGVSSPYVIGIITESRFGSSIEAEFISIQDDSKVFTNFPVFDGTEAQPISTTYQVRQIDRTAPKEYTNTRLVESNESPEENQEQGEIAE